MLFRKLESLPRARDGATRSATTNLGSESLPRARDGGPLGAVRRRHPGITPACAGRGMAVLDATGADWNHSRVRGTGATGRALSTAGAESLPRARDGGGDVEDCAVGGGITPACAGRGCRGTLRSRRRRNHSRVRGTGRLLGMPGEPAVESLPRARDGDVFGLCGLLSLGITPACAGRGSPQPLGELDTWNHSRVRGTGVPRRSPTDSDPESLPRARDGGDLLPQTFVGDGITPACAGRGPCATPASATARNHSRVRGTGA